jgi:uncharacterized Zn finger protein (UPF0148 family)
MIIYDCPRCKRPVEALTGRVYVACEHCGELTEVPPQCEVDTVTLDDIKAARARIQSS